MNNAVVNNSKSYFSKNGAWIAIGTFMLVAIAYAVVDAKRLYLGVVFVPGLIYLSFKNPFVFLFGFYTLLIPLDAILLQTEAGEAVSFVKYIVILVILCLCVKGVFEDKFKKPDTIVIWWILLIIYCILTMLWAIEPQRVLQGGQGNIRNAVGFLILYLVISSYKIHRKDYEMLKWWIIGGGFLTGLITMYSYEALLQSAETVKRVSIQIADRRIGAQNAIGFNLLIPTSVIIAKIMNQEKILMKVMFSVVLIVIISGIILTASRGAVLGVGVIFIVYFLFSRKKVTFLTFVLPIVILSISVAPSFFFERWGDAVESGGAGRMSIWYVGLKAIEKYWLMGAGLENFPAAFNEFYNYAPSDLIVSYRAPHNLYLGMFVELGIIGFILMVLVFIKHYKAIKPTFYSRKYDLDSIMLKASFWSMLTSSFFLDSFWYQSFWLLWMLIMIRKNAQSLIKWI